MTATHSVAISARPACAKPVFDAEIERNSIDTLVQDTLELMVIIDRTEPSDDCLLWTGATSSGHPIYKPHGCDCTLVRRAVFHLNGGMLLPRKPLDSRCGERLCINPAHLYASTISRIAKKAAALGAWKGLDRRIRISMAKRQTAKLTMEKAREIRNSPETGPVLAARYGVDKSLINNIKRGVIWRDYANPWMQLSN